MYLLPKKINQFSETICDSDKNFGVRAVVKTPTGIWLRGRNPPSASTKATRCHTDLHVLIFSHGTNIHNYMHTYERGIWLLLTPTGKRSFPFSQFANYLQVVDLRTAS